MKILRLLKFLTTENCPHFFSNSSEAEAESTFLPSMAHVKQLL